MANKRNIPKGLKDVGSNYGRGKSGRDSASGSISKRDKDKASGRKLGPDPSKYDDGKRH